MNEIAPRYNIAPGTKVRHHTFAHGWMFGTVVDCKDNIATVAFPAYKGRYQPYEAQMRSIHVWFVERCTE